jgi:autotransporter passenger strand-loop-strand repeat protein
MTTTFVSSGVVSSGVVVTSGNELEVLSGGTADKTTISAGGILQVDSGGFASNTTDRFGGYDYVYGVASGTIVSSGGQRPT